LVLASRTNAGTGQDRKACRSGDRQALGGALYAYRRATLKSGAYSAQTRALLDILQRIEIRLPKPYPSSYGSAEDTKNPLLLRARVFPPVLSTLTVKE